MKDKLIIFILLYLSAMPCIPNIVKSCIGVRQIASIKNNNISPIPSEYTIVEYLRNEGKTQYIDTSIIGGDGLTVQTEIKPLEVVFDKWAMGAYDIDARIYVAYQYYTGMWGGGYGMYYQGKSSVNLGLKISLVSIFTPTNQVLMVDDVEVDRFPKSSNYNPLNLSHSLYLFGVNFQNKLTSPFLCEIGRTTIWMNDEIMRDLFPIRFVNENGDDEGAMYDVINGELLRNQGSGSFTIGPDV